ncbi:MAG: hypothetical protein WAN51_03635 [Alphaproteobacteria bacterium]
MTFLELDSRAAGGVLQKRNTASSCFAENRIDEGYALFVTAS